MDDKNGNPGHTHPEMVSTKLCTESRSHMETKLNNMQRSIRWSVYLASAVLGAAIMLFQWYLTVNHYA